MRKSDKRREKGQRRGNARDLVVAFLCSLISRANNTAHLTMAQAVENPSGGFDIPQLPARKRTTDATTPHAPATSAASAAINPAEQHDAIVQGVRSIAR